MENLGLKDEIAQLKAENAKEVAELKAENAKLLEQLETACAREHPKGAAAFRAGGEPPQQLISPPPRWEMPRDS